MIAKPDESAAWAFCLTEYARPGAAEALLAAQDGQGLDVVLHLFARYAREHLGVPLGDAELAAAAAEVAPWRNEVVLPLRALSRALKPMVASDAEAALRERLKAVELEAERLQLERLCEWLSRRGAA